MEGTKDLLRQFLTFYGFNGLILFLDRIKHLLLPSLITGGFIRYDPNRGEAQLWVRQLIQK